MPARNISTLALIVARIDRNSGSAPSPMRLPVLRLCIEIGVEHGVGVPREPALAEIHQQEGEVVEDVDRGEPVVELDGVEQDRRAVDLDDVAQMKIAVAMAHISSARPRFQQRRECREPLAAEPRQLLGRFRRNDAGVGGKGLRIVAQHVGERPHGLVGPSIRSAES